MNITYVIYTHYLFLNAFKNSLGKCPVEAIYIQLLAQSNANDYFTSHKNSNATHVNLIRDANDTYKQLLLSVGEYVNEILLRIKIRFFIL